MVDLMKMLSERGYKVLASEPGSGWKMWFPALPFAPNARLAMGVRIPIEQDKPTAAEYPHLLEFRYDDLINRLPQDTAKRFIEDYVTHWEDVVVFVEPDSWAAALMETPEMEMLISNVRNELWDWSDEEEIEPVSEAKTLALAREYEKASLESLLGSIP